MVLADKKLFLAGSPDIVPVNDPLAALEGHLGGILKVVSAMDGNHIAEYPLKSKPIFDGLIATRGKLLISSQEGEIICMGKK